MHLRDVLPPYDAMLATFVVAASVVFPSTSPSGVVVAYEEKWPTVVAWRQGALVAFHFVTEPMIVPVDTFDRAWADAREAYNVANQDDRAAFMSAQLSYEKIRNIHRRLEEEGGWKPAGRSH